MFNNTAFTCHLFLEDARGGPELYSSAFLSNGETSQQLIVGKK